MCWVLGVQTLTALCMCVGLFAGARSGPSKQVRARGSRIAPARRAQAPRLTGPRLWGLSVIWSLARYRLAARERSCLFSTRSSGSVSSTMNFELPTLD